MKHLRTVVAVAALSFVAPALAAETASSGSGSEKAAAMQPKPASHKQSTKHHTKAKSSTPASSTSHTKESGSTGSSAKSSAQ